MGTLSPSQLALDYGIKFMETSAKANINVENVSLGPCWDWPLRAEGVLPEGLAPAAECHLSSGALPGGSPCVALLSVQGQQPVEVPGCHEGTGPAGQPARVLSLALGHLGSRPRVPPAEGKTE